MSRSRLQSGWFILALGTCGVQLAAVGLWLMDLGQATGAVHIPARGPGSYRLADTNLPGPEGSAVGIRSC